MGALSGVRVLDETTGLAGAYAGALLADQGAEVVRVAAPETGCLLRGRRWVVLPEGSGQGAEALLARADVLLEDAPGGPKQRNNDAIARIDCWIPPFAPDSAAGGWRAGPGSVEAWMGLYAPPVGGRPAAHSLGVLPMTAALYAVNGVVAALLAREASGAGQQVVCPQADAAYALLELNAMFTMGAPRRWATLAWAATPFIGSWAAARGGWIYLHVGLRAHLARFLDVAEAAHPAEGRALRAALGPATLAEPTSVGSAAEQLRVRRALGALFAREEAPWWEATLSAAGLCAATVQSAAAWRQSPHARGSEQVVEVGGALAPGVAVALSETPGAAVASTTEELAAVLERWGEPGVPPAAAAMAPAAPLAGVRVLDLTQVIAGPTAGRTLAELGATVHRLENPRFTAPWVEAFHVAFNAGKSSEVVDLTTEAGRRRLGEVLETLQPDVVLQNLRPGAAEALGLGEAAVRARCPEVIYAHLTAWGDAGPWAERPGWEQTAQAACGVQEAWGGSGAPALFPLPFNDLGTGLLGAFGVQAALLARRRGAGGQRVGASLSATATWMQAPTLFDGALAQRGASSLGAHAGRRAYRLADGWAWLSAEDDGLRGLAVVEGLEGCAGRGGPGLAAALEEALAAAPLAVWKARLDAAQLGAQVALTPWRTWRAALAEPRAAEVGLVKRREHPGIGAVTETGPPLRLLGTPAVKTAPAARRGDLAAAPAPPLWRWVRAQARGALGLALR